MESVEFIGDDGEVVGIPLRTPLELEFGWKCDGCGVYRECGIESTLTVPVETCMGDVALEAREAVDMGTFELGEAAPTLVERTEPGVMVTGRAVIVVTYGSPDGVGYTVLV